MKNISLIVWITQLGLSVSVPPACFILVAVWLRARFNLGSWILWIAIVLGVYSAAMGLWTSLRTLERLSRPKKEDGPPSFNDHC